MLKKTKIIAIIIAVFFLLYKIEIIKGMFASNILYEPPSEYFISKNKLEKLAISINRSSFILSAQSTPAFTSKTQIIGNKI